MVSGIEIVPNWDNVLTRTLNEVIGSICGTPVTIPRSSDDGNPTCPLSWTLIRGKAKLHHFLDLNLDRNGAQFSEWRGFDWVTDYFHVTAPWYLNAHMSQVCACYTDLSIKHHVHKTLLCKQACKEPVWCFLLLFARMTSTVTGLCFHGWQHVPWHTVVIWTSSKMLC